EFPAAGPPPAEETAESGGSLLSASRLPPSASRASRKLADVSHDFSNLLVRQFTFELRHGIVAAANLLFDGSRGAVASPLPIDKVRVRKSPGRNRAAVAVSVVAGGALLDKNPA